MYIELVRQFDKRKKRFGRTFLNAQDFLVTKRQKKLSYFGKTIVL